MKKIITLDGPAGVGKSTIARLVAEQLKIPVLDTGAMYRSLAYNLGEKALRMNDEELATACKKYKFTLSGSGDSSRLYCYGELIGDEVRTEEIATLASRLSQRQAVRQALLEAQRELGKNFDLVAEGRDMGTVVFPDAGYKFFLDASPETRALRRQKDLKKMGTPVPDLGEIEETIRRRDEQDRTRAIAPLKPAPDAKIIDTTNLDITSVLKRILSDIHD